MTATGWAYLDGEHINRATLKRNVERRGGVFYEDFSPWLTDVLVLGELRPHQLQSDREGGVEAIAMLAETRRARLRHVHLIGTDDLRAFLDGERVRCRQIPRWWSDTANNQTSRRQKRDA